MKSGTVLNGLSPQSSQRKSTEGTETARQDAGVAILQAAESATFRMTNYGKW
jgi:hypothetical protein